MNLMTDAGNRNGGDENDLPASAYITAPVGDCEDPQATTVDHDGCKKNRTFTEGDDGSLPKKGYAYSSSISTAMPGAISTPHEEKFQIDLNLIEFFKPYKDPPLVKFFGGTCPENDRLRDLKLKNDETKDISFGKPLAWCEMCPLTMCEVVRWGDVIFFCVKRSKDNLKDYFKDSLTFDRILNILALQLRDMDVIIDFILSEFLTISLEIDILRIKMIVCIKINVSLKKGRKNFCLPMFFSMSNGFLNGGKIASNQVQICLSIITNFIFETQRKSTADNWTETFDTPGKVIIVDEGQEILDWSILDDGSASTEIVSSSERPMIYLGAPGPRRYSSKLVFRYFNAYTNKSAYAPPLTI